MHQLSELYYFLENLSDDERANFQKIIKSNFGDSPECLCDQMVYLRSGAIGQLFSELSYKQLVTDVADHIKVDWSTLCQERTWGNISIAEIENAIVIKTFSEMYERLSDIDKQKLRDELNRIAKDKGFHKEFITASGLILANLSGFQIYLLATTTLGALSSFLGIVFPFLVYTTLTRTIAAIIGPAGWIALGLITLLHLNSPNWSKLIAGIIYISYLRNISSLEFSLEKYPEIVGTWHGKFGSGTATLVVKKQLEKIFEGILIHEHFWNGTAKVKIRGNLDSKDNKISIFEGEILSGYWRAGENQGTLSTDQKRMSGTGKDSSKTYSWCFEKVS